MPIDTPACLWEAYDEDEAGRCPDCGATEDEECDPDCDSIDDEGGDYA